MHVCSCLQDTPEMADAVLERVGLHHEICRVVLQLLLFTLHGCPLLDNGNAGGPMGFPIGHLMVATAIELELALAQRCRLASLEQTTHLEMRMVVDANMFQDNR